MLLFFELAATKKRRVSIAEDAVDWSPEKATAPASKALGAEGSERRANVSRVKVTAKPSGRPSVVFTISPAPFRT